MSTPQQALVSLADAPANLRDVAALCYHESDQRDQAAKREGPRNRYGLTDFHQEMARKHNANGDFLLALASSLEQLHPGDSNTNSDQVTITLSREDAHKLWMGAEGLRHLEAGEALNTYECGDPDAWSRIAGVAYRAYGAALNNSTPERRG